MEDKNREEQLKITVPEYIAQFPDKVQERLELLRILTIEIAPEATEYIAWGMIGYKLNKKPLLYFAAFKNHVGFYALPKTHHRFTEALEGYKQGKGSVQFPHNKEFPLDLIRDIIAYRVVEVENFKTRK